MKAKLIILAVPMLLLALLINGCNILSWTAGENSETLLDEGKRLMRDADYAGAVEKFAAAISEDPYSSDALYLHAKATVHASGFNALNLADILSESNFALGDELPFTGVLWPTARADSLFQTMITVYEDLALIIQDSTHGSFDSIDVDLDYGLASGFRGVLGFQDTDANGIIENADFPIQITYGDAGTEFQIDNLLGYFDYYINPTKKMVVGKVAIPEQIPQEYIDQFNDYINNIDSWLEDAIAIIMALLEDSELDLQEIETTLREIAQIADYFKVADGIDNDGDGRIDEEIVDGIDNDLDGWTDEDTDGRIDFDYL